MPKRIIATWFVLVLLVGTAGAALNRGTSDDFAIPGTPAQSAIDTLQKRFPELAGTSAVVLVRAPEGQNVRTADFSDEIAALVKELRALPQVTAVANPLTDPDSPLVSDDGGAALVQVQWSVPLDEISDADLEGLASAGESLRDNGATVTAGGDAFNGSTPALSIIEALGIALALLLLYLMLRSWRASLIPIVSAVAGALVTMATLMLATTVTSISSTAPMLALMIGLAVGIDYSLLIVVQFRENLRQGLTANDAAARAVATSGTAVLFAGGTVAIALVALAIAGIPFLTTMGFAAAVGVAIAVAAALTLAPALSIVLSARLHPRAKASRPNSRARRDLLDRWVSAVTRRPLVTAVAVVIVLVAIAAPALSLRLALPSGASAPHDSDQYLTYRAVSEEFGPGFNAPILVTADLLSSTDPVADVDDIEARLRQVDGVQAITLATPNAMGDMGAFVVIGDAAPDAQRTAELVQRLRDASRDLDGDADYALAVTGQTALQIDVSQVLEEALLPYAAVVVALSFALLAVAFRSWLMPLVAALGYLLSVFAALGLTSAVFIHGYGADALNIQHVGPVISFLPIILMGVLFGLAMDYQVFLASRIWEVRAGEGASADAAIKAGFRRSAPVVITAALIMLGVFASFIPEGSAILQPIAFALAVGVTIDAFVVRLVLMPAVLHLAGDRAWAFPAKLDRALPRVDLEGATLTATSTADPHTLVGLRGASLRGPRGPILERTDFIVTAGQVGLVVGSAGSGRTLTLLALAGRAPLAGGDLVVNGVELHDGSAMRRVAITEFVGINDLDDGLTVAQHVAEALSAVRMRPWVTRRATHREVEEFNAWVADFLPEVEPLAAEAQIETLDPLQRRLLSVLLAQLSAPDVIVVDDVDNLRVEREQIALWRLAFAVVHSEDPRRHAAVVMSSRQVPAYVRDVDVSVLHLDNLPAESRI